MAEAGVPANPRGWLLTVARRRQIEAWRADTARRRREENAARLERPAHDLGPTEDDTLALYFLCCHPSLTPASQVALTLRAVGGLTTAEIARALLVPEATVAQRISRAKARIRESGAKFTLPAPQERAERLGAVLHTLYLIFNEGYAATSGSALVRIELTAEAIRLARQLHAVLADDGEVTGLLALMLLTEARRSARTTTGGALIPLAEQDRRLWDRLLIAEGRALLRDALTRTRAGPYQLQGAIAALHDEAPTAEATDWPQILALYELLAQAAPGPMVTLGRIVALAMVEGPTAGLEALAAVQEDLGLVGNHRVDAVRAHLLEVSGDAAAARLAYLRAARITLSLPEQRYLEDRARRLAESPPDDRRGPSQRSAVSRTATASE